jgi:acetylornithine deacetylase
MDRIQERVLAEIERREGSMVAFLQALVRQPSTLGNELGAQQIVYRKLKSLGLAAELWKPRLDLLRTHPAFAPVEWSYEGRPNVTAALKGQGGRGESLVLNGHIDVVSPEPSWGWSRDPWGAEIVGRRLYGRGAFDMKGGIATSILALEGILAAGVVLHGDVFVETVLEEECCGNGTLACRLKGYSSTASAAIVTEGTDLAVHLADMGVMWFRVRVRGSSGHVGRAHEANNAIEKCFPLIQALRELEAEMNRQVSHPAYIGREHPVNLNVGTIEGGHWPSSVPADCAFVCRLSYEPGVEYGDIRRRVETCVLEAAQQDPWLAREPPRLEYFGFQAEGSTVDRDSPLLERLGRAHRQVTGEELQYVASTALTDIRYFNLYSGIPATDYGPTGANAHNVDEYVELDSIVTAARTLALFVLDWCGYEDQD